MRLNVHIDTRNLELRLERERKRLAFNAALALNETVKAVQTAERVNLDRKLTLRKTGFMYRLIKIITFANARQNRPYAELAIDPTKQRVLVGKLERGGEKLPEIGKSVGVPLTGGPARPSFQQSVRPELQIGRLRVRQHRTAAGKVQYKGAKRTFIVRGVGIFQRGEGQKTSRRRRRFRGLVQRTSVRLLYLFRKAPKLRAMLGFFDVAHKTAAEQWPQQFRKAYRKP